ncbi:MAG: alginate export family protein [Gammaproteobacteria bacterium]|nr:alginate export family protein [Gammaproteobacteria bacterium]MDH5799512.1 alginate export family protein [Gammaproteobacteria bacterium]
MATIPLAWAGSDKPPSTNNQISEELAYGGRVEFESRKQGNFNLDDTKAEDETRNRPLVSLALRYSPKENISAYLNADFARYMYDDEAQKKVDKTELSIVNAYLQLDNVFNTMNIKLGRMRTKDEREWLFDEELDGARFELMIPDGAVEFFAFEKNHKDTMNTGANEGIRNYLLYGRYEYIKDNQLMAYYLIQDDKTAGQRNAQFFGLQAQGELGDMDYWLETGLVGGDEAGQSIDGFGYDLGFYYTFKSLPARPRLIMGYAYGSGDNNLTDNVDGNFRQTGYQDNDSKNGGIERYNIYGEMVDMELSNVKVTTLGLGFRYQRSFSFDVVHHTYTQDVASSNIRNSEIDEIPNGTSTDLGSALDIIVGGRPTKDTKVTYTVGYFYPGQAFPNADNALFTELAFKYNF